MQIISAKWVLTVLDVTEVRESPFSALFQRKRKVKIGDLAMFSRQLQTLLESGIPLTRALHTLSYQTTNRDLSQVLNQTAQSVDSGMSFSDSLMNFPDVFSSMYINMIKSGEVSGNLDEVLKQLADQLDRDKSLRDNIKAATFYPLVVLEFRFSCGCAMLVGVVPVFMRTFFRGHGAACAYQNCYRNLQFITLILVSLYHCHYSAGLWYSLLSADTIRQPPGTGSDQI